MKTNRIWALLIAAAMLDVLLVSSAAAAFLQVPTALMNLCDAPEYTEIAQLDFSDWLDDDICDQPGFHDSAMTLDWENAYRVELLNLSDLKKSVTQAPDYQMTEHLEPLNDPTQADHIWYLPVKHGDHTHMITVIHNRLQTQAELDQEYTLENYPVEGGWTQEELDDLKARILTNAGKWEAVSMTGYSPSGEAMSRAKLCHLIQSAGFGEPLEAKQVMVRNGYRVLLLETVQGEYIIPLHSSLGEVENQRLYSAREYLRMMADSLGEEPFADPNMDGGLAGGSAGGARPRWLLPAVAVLGLLGVIGGVLRRRILLQTNVETLAGPWSRIRTAQLIRQSPPRPHYRIWEALVKRLPDEK